MILALLLAFSAQERAAMNRITPREIAAHIRFLADDQLEGRKPGEPGDELAIKYLASQLESMGYKPAAGNGTFLQPVPLVQLAMDVPKDVQFNSGANNLTLHAGIGLQSDLVIEPNAQKERSTVKD